MTKWHRFQIFIMILLVSGLIGGTLAQAQDDPDPILETIRTAFSATLAQENYTAEWDNTAEQTVILVDGTNRLQFVSELDISRDLSRAGQDYTVTIRQNIEQSQQVNNGNAITSDVELDFDAVMLDGTMYINLEPTSAQFRPDLPEGWQVVDETLQLPQEVSVSLDELTTFLESAWLQENYLSLLTPEVVSSIEDEGERSGTQRYLLTLNLQAALEAQNIDLNSLLGELPQEVGLAMLDNAEYVMEVRIDTTTALLSRVTISLEFAVEYPAGTLSGDFANTAISLSYVQEHDLQLGNFDTPQVITAPTLVISEEG
jgi:hypothetical protein